MNAEISGDARKPRVMKFGGTSLGNAGRVERAAHLVSEAAASRPVVVVASAMAEITDTLVALAEEAAGGDDAYPRHLNGLVERHMEVAGSVSLPGDRARVEGRITGLLQDLATVVAAVHRVKDCSDLRRDLILSFGERLSAVLLAAAIRGKGLDSEDHDARRFLITDRSFGNASVLLDESKARISSHFSSQKGIPVVTGYIGATEDGETTTLGRNSSDLSAAVIAAALGADALELWTDVNGIMTADPRVVPEARSLPKLGYREVNDLSRFGAKVVFPHTVQTVMARGIPIVVKNTLDPSFSGTLIGSESPEDRDVLSVTALDSLVLIHVRGAEPGNATVPSLGARALMALGRSGVPVLGLAQTPSEVTMAVHMEAATRGVVELEDMFAKELADGQLRLEDSQERVAIVTVVGGCGIPPGVLLDRSRKVVEEGGLNTLVEILEEAAVRLVVPSAQQGDFVRLLHQGFSLGPAEGPQVFLCGVGNVGSEVLRTLSRAADRLDVSGENVPRVLGLCNSRKSLSTDSGVPPEALEVLETSKSEAHELLTRARSRPGSVLVDCTASEAVAETYAETLAAGTSVVTANKILLSGPLEGYRAVFKAAKKGGASFRYEATVGAGLPVIGAISGLVAGGDRILRIEGCMSGTLTYLMARMMEDVAFSQAIAEAESRGLTEPDPRTDLGGVDVARKLVILAREATFDLSLSEVWVDPLLPAEFETLSLEMFRERLPELDGHFSGLVRQAKESGETLTFMGTLREGSATVGMEAVGQAHPAAGLRPMENLFRIWTEAYSEVPLTIRGPGAGPAVTAMGVVTDVMKCVRRRGM